MSGKVRPATTRMGQTHSLGLCSEFFFFLSLFLLLTNLFIEFLGSNLPATGCIGERGNSDDENGPRHVIWALHGMCSFIFVFFYYLSFL